MCPPVFTHFLEAVQSEEKLVEGVDLTRYAVGSIPDAVAMMESEGSPV